MSSGTNSHNIQPFEAGKPLIDQLTATRLNAILTALDHGRVRPGRGYDVAYYGPGGTVLDITAGKGGSVGIIPGFSLIKASTPTQARVRLTMSSINGWIPSVFAPGDDPKYIFNVTEDGFVWAWVSWDETGTLYPEDGGRGVSFGATVPDDEEFLRHTIIGTYHFVAPTPPLTNPSVLVANARYGPIDAVICRNWFTNPPTWNVSF